MSKSDGRVVRKENGECESPARIDYVTPRGDWKDIIEDWT